jgi:2C-methyl-D-erythritol 2,4-cyclodiphosphate synthase
VNGYLRSKLKSAGYKFENGNWYKNQSDGNLATHASVDQLLAA